MLFRPTAQYRRPAGSTGHKGRQAGRDQALDGAWKTALEEQRLAEGQRGNGTSQAPPGRGR
jgi:hypothetical protein